LIVLGSGPPVGEVAPVAPGYQDFLAYPVGVFQDEGPASPLPGLGGAHQAGGSGANYDHVVAFRSAPVATWLGRCGPRAALGCRWALGHSNL